MRLIANFLIIVLLLCGKISSAQKISISQDSISLDKALSLIQQQSDYSFLFDNKKMKQSKKINVHIQNFSVDDALKYCLKDLPFTYIISDRIIIIKEKEVQSNFQNTYKITGNVSDQDGKYLAGASVYIKSLNKGVHTNDFGDFLLEEIPRGQYILRISFVGFETIEKKIEVESITSDVKIILQHIQNNLSEIAVTALGINRKYRSLSYSMQSISGDEISTVKNTNILNSLIGKVAGAQFNRTSGGVGGAVRVILRGDKSTRNSQPLYVIDGMPILNPIGGPNAGLYNSYPDPGDIISTFNPDDIESINVLKGASASALYGSQGSNGVILINTKRGKGTQNSIQYSSSVTFDKVSIIPKMQFDYYQTLPSTDLNPGSEDSWGAKGAALLDKNYVSNFFKTGVTFINSISINNSGETNSNFISYSNTYNKGILPTSTFKQNTLSLRQTSKFFDKKLLLDASFMGALQDVKNRLTPGIYFNPLSGLYLFPRGQNFDLYNNFEYFSQSRYLNAQNWWNIHYDKNIENGGGWGGQDYQQNPYWILNRNSIENSNQNIYTSFSLKYSISNNLSIQTRGNINYFSNQSQRNIFATTQATYSSYNGNLQNFKSSSATIYGDVMVLWEKEINKNWHLNSSVGLALQKQNGKFISILGTPSVPNVFLESALDNQSVLDIRNRHQRKTIQSAFVNLQINYKNKYYFEFSDRNDWSSTLAFTPFAQTGYNYYSFGTSAILSEIFKLPQFLNFGKLHFSYALVGNDIAAFSTKPIYTFSLGGISNPPASTPINIPGYFLKPEKNRSFEFGTQWNLLQNKFLLDITWYKSNIINQYFQRVTVPPGLGSGGFADINSGNIQNKGLEIMLTSRIFSSKKFSWIMVFNYAHNRNRVVQLLNSDIVANPSPNQIYTLEGGSGGFDGVLKLGESYGDIYGTAFKKDVQGRIIVNSQTGLPQIVNSVKLGNPNPNSILGLNNTIKINNFSIKFLIDGKFGGKVLSITEGYLDQMGISERSGNVRNSGGIVYLYNAVDENGNKWNQPIDAKKYFKFIGGKTAVDENYMFDATTVRLREFSISVSLPPTKFFKSVVLGIIANNVFFLYRKAPFDSEQVAGVNPGGVGVDAFGLPAFRSIGFSFKCSL